MTPEKKIAAMNAMLDAIGDALREQSVTLEELIESGREIRGKLIEEKYGISSAPPDDRLSTPTKA